MNNLEYNEENIQRMNELGFYNNDASKFTRHIFQMIIPTASSNRIICLTVILGVPDAGIDPEVYFFTEASMPSGEKVMTHKSINVKTFKHLENFVTMLS